MTKLAILSSNERLKFDSPPKFDADERALYFSLTKAELNLVQELRTSSNKVGFILQLGYFKVNGKFYITEQFRQQDINYVIKMLGFEPTDIDLSSYQKKIPTDHRKKILALLKWQPFNEVAEEKINEHVKWLVQRQLSFRSIFLSIIDFCWQNKIELPSYNVLSSIIVAKYNEFENELINTLADKLTLEQIEKLNQLANIHSEKRLQRPKITLIKKINQSLSPTDIQENVDVFKMFKEYFHEFQSTIVALNLTDQATEYFSIWVQKSTTFQLNSLTNKNKLYLHLLCYIKHQFYFRQDLLVDILLKSVQSVVNTANKQINQQDKKRRPERNKAITKITTSNKDARELIEQLTEIVKSPILLAQGKLEQIEQLLDQYNTIHDDTKKKEIVKIEQSLGEISEDTILFNILETLSIKLQNRVDSIVKNLTFNNSRSSTKLIAAIDYFRKNEVILGKDIPIGFLNNVEKNALYKEEKLRTSLYKVFLFIHIADSIKSGDLNILYTYRYRAIQEYLINDDLWKTQYDKLIYNAGLSNFVDFNNTIDDLKLKLEEKYKIINERFLNNENPHLKFDKNGKIIIATPDIDSDNTKYSSSLLSQSGFVPILRILNDINNIVQFTENFKHFSIKHKKLIPKATTIFAGLIGKGCNIGINKIANISIGINESNLRNTVNWCFSLKNIQAANNKIIHMISKLFLANYYRHNAEELHTGSDGSKYSVAVDSILASYSFKYFGKGKGVTVYTYLDERHLLFHSTVISSSEREAAYVIDGLLQNEVIKSDIHSVDTHGFTEVVFAVSPFINTAFAPRIKDIGEQRIYAFSAKQTYEKRGYKILPSRTINLQLIEKHWDDILCFMATIKLKYTSASQLLKRLSSYAKDHPLYKAIKEFGRIIKSIFILTYYDDVKLRQRIEKQLNKVELSNRFYNVIFFAENQEFQTGTKEEQEIATACTVLIQNAIILWNYLYLSQLVASHEDLEERKRMIDAIKRGSIIVWSHINLSGEYNFLRYAANDSHFDMAKILALKSF